MKVANFLSSASAHSRKNSRESLPISSVPQPLKGWAWVVRSAARTLGLASPSLPQQSFSWNLSFLFQPSSPSPAPHLTHALIVPHLDPDQISNLFLLSFSDPPCSPSITLVIFLDTGLPCEGFVPCFQG